MRPRKTERNKKLVALRDKGLSYREIAKILVLDVSAVYVIYQRDKNEFKKRVKNRC